MDRKRKRRRSESSSGLNGQLCEKCSCIFATVENLRKLATWPGFKHHGEIELRDYARDGCTLCALFYEKLKPKDQEGKNVGSLFLSPLAHHGETPLRTTAKSRYPGVIMNTSCLYSRWEIGDSQKHTFDIVSAQDNRTKLEFPNTPLSYHLNSEMVVAEIQKRLKVCQERHVCSNTSISYLPTRVIDVGSTSSKRPPYLHISRKYEKGCYAALSCCWGGPQRVITTSDNIHSFTKTLPMDTIPKTIQDALNVTQKLGLRYLWIDAFCILQDSPHDKAKEIDTMGTIYQNATITIAATGAKSVENGFLQNFSRQHSASLAFQLPKKFVANVTVVENIPRWDDGPLGTRAWAFQEFYLLARVLLYGINGDLRWHCQRDKFGPLFGKKPVIQTKTTRRLKSKQVSWSRKLAYRKNKQVYPKLTDDRSTMLRMSQFIPWHRFIEGFSGRNITEPEDRLPALAGIARYMSDSLQDVYFAGTWRSDLIHHISWGIYRWKDYYSRPCLTAPSWSWASVNKRVEFYEVRKISQAQVVSCDIDPIDRKAPFGQVREGALKLRAPVLKPGKDSARFLSWEKRDFEVTMDNTYDMKPDPSEVEFVRLGLSRVQYAYLNGSKPINRFLGIIVIDRGDGRYKRIGRFDHRDRGDLHEGPECFLESRNSLEPWSAAWEKAEVKDITIV